MNVSTFKSTSSNRVTYARSEIGENRRYVTHYEEERRRRVEGGGIFTEVVQSFERSQQEINQKLDNQSKTLDQTLKSLATLPQTIKTEVLNSTEFKKIQSRSLRNDHEVYKLKKKFKDLETSFAKVVESGAAKLGERRSSTHSHHKSSRNDRSSAQRSRSDSDRDKKAQQERSGRRDHEPQPGPSGVVTARFTHDGRTVHRRRDLDQVDSDDDRSPTTRDWQTRRARGPGDPPLRKGDTATGNAVQKGPINRIREKSVAKKRKAFLYSTKEKALNEIERLMRSGIDSDEAIFRIAQDKEKTKCFEDAKEANLKTWYAARKDIREKIRRMPRIRELRACKGFSF